jgi:hypothetical protein
LELYSKGFSFGYNVLWDFKKYIATFCDRSTQFTPMQHFSGNTLPIVYFEKFEHITFKIDQKIFW